MMTPKMSPDIIEFNFLDPYIGHLRYVAAVENFGLYHQERWNLLISGHRLVNCGSRMKRSWAREMAWWRKCLLCKSENLSSFISTEPI